MPFKGHTVSVASHHPTWIEKEEIHIAIAQSMVGPAKYFGQAVLLKEAGGFPEKQCPLKIK